MIKWIRKQDPFTLVMGIAIAPLVIGILVMVYYMVWVTVLDILRS